MNTFEINVADLRRSHASERDVAFNATVDWALELSRVERAVPGADNLSAQLTLSPISGGLLVHGTAKFTARHSCHRCLDEWTEEMEVPVSAMFSPGSGESDDETFPLADVIDLETALRDDVLLSLPLSPTCQGGCSAQLVATSENGLNTPASAELTSADGIPEDQTGEGSPFSVLRELLEPGD